jgi:hypothetical protein
MKKASMEEPNPSGERKNGVLMGTFEAQGGMR